MVTEFYWTRKPVTLASSTVRNQEAGQPGKLACSCMYCTKDQKIVLPESLRLGQLSKNILEMNVVFK
jgi:hypothetical protein